MLLDNKNNNTPLHFLNSCPVKQPLVKILTGAIDGYGFDKLQALLSDAQCSELFLTNFNSDSLQSFVAAPDALLSVNELNQKYKLRALHQWVSMLSEVKASKIPQPLSNNLISLQSEDAATAVQGTVTVTPSGLGVTTSSQFQMSNGFTGAEAVKPLADWFDSIWSDPQASLSVKEELLAVLAQLTEDKSPAFIYYLMLYRLFQGLMEEVDEESIINSKTGFKDSIVWNKLYPFQKDGVIGAIDKLERFNGCIIADSVGLGKTFEALAVIKYYELRNDRVLVLCPKKLRDNWTVYTLNDKRNLLASDRFGYDVLNHTDLSRHKGMSGEINLQTINWSNYDLIVIDESHNFRNSPNKQDGKTRYKRLLEDVLKAGVKTKVLMLSATPVNNRMNDLKNQIAFITEGRDDAFLSQGIPSLENTMRKAQIMFNQWSKLEAEERTTASLLDMMSFDYFKTLDLTTIARSRKHIEKYYGTAEIGQFPTRLKPKNIYAEIADEGTFPPLKEINKTIKRLTLAGYSPMRFVLPSKVEEYAARYDKAVGEGKGVFKQVDREASLVHLMRVNLLKRMESSIHSFRLTAEKLLAQVEGLLAKIEEHKSSDIDVLNIEELQDVELDMPELEPLLVGNKTKVLLQDMDLIRFKSELQSDCVFLADIVAQAKNVTPELDLKLAELKQAITNKIDQPLNPDNKKAIVFTAFADTAEYLYDNLALWALEEHGVHTGLVTGSGTNKTTLKKSGTDLSSILTNFSPVSKERDKIEPDAEGELDLLIGTDCISEGQNLQDCDTLINYDIHWNPVRIIQRFGRIDRLGSKNTQIQLINFWPNMQLDEYINLEARVSGRMVLLDISATGEENVIDGSGQEMNDLEYRRNQLQQLQDAVVDLEDMSGGVSITDLTLNDFRMDLSHYINADHHANLHALQQAPSGYYAVARLSPQAIQDGVQPGILFCLHDISPNAEHNPADANYSMAPYYLVYVSADGEVVLNFSQSKKILDVTKFVANHNSQVDEEAEQALSRLTKNGKDTMAMRSLLTKAIESIQGKASEIGVESLFSKGGTSLSGAESALKSSFLVSSYLVLLGHEQ